MASLVSQDGIFKLFIPTFLTTESTASIMHCLDLVEANSGPTALILCSSDPNTFCAGMNVKFILKNGPRSASTIVNTLFILISRLLTFSVPTIAAINGHAVAGGLLLALCLDYRIMSKGSLKMNEIHLGLPMPITGSLLLKSKLAPNVHRDLVLRGKSYSAYEALEAKIVDWVVKNEELISKAEGLAKMLKNFGEKKDIIKALKVSCYFEVVEYAENSVDEDEVIKGRKIELAPKI